MEEAEEAVFKVLFGPVEFLRFGRELVGVVEYHTGSFHQVQGEKDVSKAKESEE